MFHVCFLMGTPIHMHLAKQMLKHFPLLLNDIYLSEEYYGENVLHMAAVAEVANFRTSLILVTRIPPLSSGSWTSVPTSTAAATETSSPVTTRRARGATTRTTR